MRSQRRLVSPIESGVVILPSLYTGLLANYKLDETSGTTAIDETGNHNGIINGTPTLGVPANLGTGYSLNGNTANFVDLGTRNLIGGRSAFTIAGWSKCLSFDIQGNLYGAWTGTRICSFSNNGFSTRWVNYIYIGGVMKGGAFNFTEGQFNAGSYQLMISTYDGVTFRTFVNNNEAAESFPATGSVQVGSGENESIGRGFTSGQNRTISSLQIWDRALNADERANLFNGGMGQIL